MNQLYERKNPHRLFRDRENAMLAGVCAGIAEYFGLNRKGVRLVTVLLMLIPPFFAFVLVSYIVLEQLLVDVAQRPFPDIARQMLFEPLGMKNSTYAQPLPEERWPQAAVGHVGVDAKLVALALVHEGVRAGCPGMPRQGLRRG